MMHPHIVLHWPAVVVAVLASFVFGWIWHGPLFGKVWMKAAGMKPGDCKGKDMKKMMLRGMALQLFATFLTAYVMVFSTEIWRASVWHSGAADGPAKMYAFYSGFFVWLGFFLPMRLSKVAWERCTAMLFVLATVYDFLNLQLIAQIIEHMR